MHESGEYYVWQVDPSGISTGCVADSCSKTFARELTTKYYSDPSRHEGFTYFVLNKEEIALASKTLNRTSTIAAIHKATREFRCWKSVIGETYDNQAFLKFVIDVLNSSNDQELTTGTRAEA